MVHAYFIRHGETSDNTAGRIPREDARLSSVGIAQTMLAAETLTHNGITSLYSSELERARQTADILSQHLSIVPVQVDGLFNERRLPTVLLGRSHDDPYAQRIFSEMENNGSNSAWKYDTEENHSEFFRRVQDALLKIEQLGPSNVLVCTHAGFIKAAFSFIQNEGKSTYEKFKSIDDAYKVTGASILHLSYDAVWRIEESEAVSVFKPR